MDQTQTQNIHLNQIEQAPAAEAPLAERNQTSMLLNEWDLLLVGGGDMVPVW